MEVAHGQLPPAGRALLLKSDGGLYAFLAEDVAADSRRCIDQLIDADWAGELWFPWEILHRCRASLRHLRL